MRKTGSEARAGKDDGASGGARAAAQRPPLAKAGELGPRAVRFGQESPVLAAQPRVEDRECREERSTHTREGANIYIFAVFLFSSFFNISVDGVEIKPELTTRVS